MNWEQTAQNRKDEMIETIKYYIAEGISKDKAIEIVKSQTTIGKNLWNEVVEAIG